MRPEWSKRALQPVLDNFNASPYGSAKSKPLKQTTMKEEQENALTVIIEAAKNHLEELQRGIFAGLNDEDAEELEKALELWSQQKSN